ncbi:MPN555 family protein chaperone [Mycoplasma suis]|uniref:Trigger factor C-terminal domain-containing protein n=1 Tax=Mycoplasma suis (strain Illinois) TaxID=768700 RepID=F0QRW5_MYCSL|nr:hypothetical protein [Mycoplasma suis]ADX98235.1 hypothetical protein MSU_0704 [Mycoplasma suis str. Illinois]
MSDSNNARHKSEFKSKITRRRPINWGTEITISEIRPIPNLVENFEEVLKAMNPGITDEEIAAKKREIIEKDNIFNFVMDEVASAYSIEFDEEEVREREKKLSESYKGYSGDEIRNSVKVMILKDLIYEDLAREWRIEVSEELARETLRDFLDKTGQKHDEYLNDPARIEMVRKSIMEQIITQRIINAFKTTIIQMDDQKDSGKILKS